MLPPRAEAAQHVVSMDGVSILWPQPLLPVPHSPCGPNLGFSELDVRYQLEIQPFFLSFQCTSNLFEHILYMPLVSIENLLLYTVKRVWKFHFLSLTSRNLALSLLCFLRWELLNLLTNGEWLESGWLRRQSYLCALTLWGQSAKASSCIFPYLSHDNVFCFTRMLWM